MGSSVRSGQETEPYGDCADKQQANSEVEVYFRSRHPSAASKQVSVSRKHMDGDRLRTHRHRRTTLRKVRSKALRDQDHTAHLQSHENKNTGGM